MSCSSSSSNLTVDSSRRTVLLAGLSSCVVSHGGSAMAVKQILLPGRVPGLSLPDENGKTFAFE